MRGKTAAFRVWWAVAFSLCLVVATSVAGEEPKPATVAGTPSTRSVSDGLPGTGTAAAPGTGTAAAPGTASGQPDCHGPLYYKLKNQDKVRREQEAARTEVERFVDSVGEKLVAANLARGKELVAQRKGEWLTCLAGTRRPSVLCQAVVRGDEKHCRFLAAPEMREPCLLLARVAAAAQARSTEACAALGDAPERRLCEFAAGAAPACEGVPERSPARQVCRALETHQHLAGDGPLSPDAVAAVAWVRALKARDASECGVMTDSGERGSCRAAALRDEGACPLDRPTIEHVDDDYSCRNLVLSFGSHATAAGTEVVVRLGGDFPGSADCQVKARLVAPAPGTVGAGTPGAGSVSGAMPSAAGVPVERTLGAVRPERGLDLTEIRGVVEGPVEAVTASCRWEPESSRFILEESKAGVW